MTVSMTPLSWILLSSVSVHYVTTTTDDDNDDDAHHIDSKVCYEFTDHYALETATMKPN